MPVPPSPSDSDPNRPSLDRLKRECTAMMKLLLKLEQEELDLRAQNEILARNALMCGFNPAVLEPPPPKRRRRTKEEKTDNSSKDEE